MIFSFLKGKKACLSFGWAGACAGYGLAIFKGLEL